MAKTRTLYGHQIIPHHMLNYSEQLYDILVEEIELGRWEINERLPGVIHLAKELGFGTKTVQTAYDRLKQDGYVTTRGYRGTYLQSMHPQAPKAAARIGVLVSEEQQGDPLVVWYEHVILEAAKKRHRVVEVKVLPGSADADSITERGALFGEDISGIISLAPYRTRIRYGESKDAIPVVFLCPPYERCVPIVCADVREAYYDLTSRVIRCGHTRIVFSEDSVEPDPRQTQLHREGYLEAMAEHGLPVDTSLIEASRLVNNADLSTVSPHLQALMERPEKERPTAVIAGSLGRSMVFTRVAPECGVRIPDDLSLVSIGSANVIREPGRQITGMLPDFDRMIERCLDMLDQQAKDGRSDLTRVQVRMHFLAGHTLKSLNGDPAATNHGAAQIRHNIANLSQSVH